MKKSDYIGWQEVFYFSLTQGIKEKAYYGFLILVSIVLILSMPVMSLISTFEKDEEAYMTEVTDFTIYDETGLPIDYSQSLVGVAFKNMTIHTAPTQTFDEHVKHLEENAKNEDAEKSTELIVHITYEDAGYFNLTFVKASNAAFSEDDCEMLTDMFREFFDEARISAIEVTQEQLAFLNRNVDTKLEFVTETGEVMPEKEKNEGISMEEYMVLLCGIMIVMMIISLSGSSIATSIVTEKSTKVVEYLMINVRPMALIVGKILASLLLVLIQFAVMGISYGISAFINMWFFGEPLIKDTVDMSGTEIEMSTVMHLLSGISVADVVVSLIVILLGIMFYSILAGLAGASVSKMDEIAEGMKIYQMTMIVGSYLGIGMCIALMTGGNNQLFVDICCLLPISAPFVVPASALLGKVSLGVSIASVVLLFILTALLFSFTAKVYESLIFYNGSVMKLKDILQIAKNRKATDKKEGK